jgi:hypothetical protein
MAKLSWLEFNIILNCQYSLQTIYFYLDNDSNELTHEIKIKILQISFYYLFYPPQIKYTQPD